LRLCERALNNRLAPIGKTAAMSAERDRCIANLALQHSERSVGGERQRAGQQTIEEHTNGVEIRSSIDFLPQDLLGRHVGRCAHQPEVDRLLFGTKDSGDSEVHDLDRPLVGDHDIGGLDVTVHDACSVRMLESREDQVDDVGGALGRQRAESLRQFVERFAAHELHHHQEVAVGAKQFVDGGDLRVIQSCEDRRFRAETRHDLGVREIGIQGFDGDITMKRLVHGFVDDAGATSPELANDPVFADGPADHRKFRALRAFGQTGNTR
jgi:hypothetical protein